MWNVNQLMPPKYSTPKYDFTDHFNAPICFMNGLYHRGERLLFIFIFYQGLGQWGGLGGVILLQLQCTSIVFNLHIITAEFYLLKLLLQNSSDSMIL